MSLTVQDLLNKAVAFLDDTDNIADYGTQHLPLASKIVTDLMREGIGINSLFLQQDLTDYTADYTVTDYIPVKLPATVTAQDQIVNLMIDNYSVHPYTETYSGSFYVLVPEYCSYVVVEYQLGSANFTALTDVLPLNDAAVISVASVGLAAILAASEAPEKANWLDDMYREAKAKFHNRNIDKPREVIDVYQYVI